jgi:DNA-binding CsgD family transcriptional regulator
MGSERPPSRAEEHLIRVCHSGLAGADLRREVLAALRRMMPIDAAFYATADPETLLFTGGWPEEPLAASAPLFLENEFGREDVNKFAALATSGRHVNSLDVATRSERGSSLRYRDIMRPLGLGDELRAALVADRMCWGYLCLHRENDPLGFTADEAAALARVAPHIAQAVRKAVLLHGPVPGGDLRPGIVLLAEELDVVAMTPEAQHLLSLLEQPARGGLPLPLPVYGVAMAFRALERGTAPSSLLPSTRVRTASGHWLNLYVSRLAGAVPGADHLAVIVEPLQPRAAAPLLLAAHGLSERESEVARLVLRGHPTRAIADELHISEHTVQDHLKAVFDKVGVRSRRELVAQVLSPPP